MPAERLTPDGTFAVPPDRAIIDGYLSGRGISAHVDRRPCFGDVGASHRPGSACAMQFRQAGGDSRLDLVLLPRGLVVMRGPARRGWTHAIPARNSDVIAGRRVLRGRRVSLTFRMMRLDG